MSFYSIFASIFALTIAITFHEAAHGAMALLFGDDTAKRANRLTFNPIPHIDPLGTLILPSLMFFSGSPFLFGWAKPVPVNFDRLAPRRVGYIAVAFAGPAINLLIAWASAMLLRVNEGGNTLGNDILLISIKINIFLAAFNLLPILPLDGGRILQGLMPKKLAYEFGKLERFGFLIIMLLVLVPHALQYLGINFQPLSLILSPLSKLLTSFVLRLSGH
jgi:Zn-dependent protease